MSRTIPNPKIPRASTTPDPNQQILFIDEPTNEQILLPPGLLAPSVASKSGSDSIASAIAMVSFFLFLITGSWFFGFLYARHLYDVPAPVTDCNTSLAVTAKELIDSLPVVAPTQVTTAPTQPTSLAPSSEPVKVGMIDLPPPKRRGEPEEKPKEKPTKAEQLLKETKTPPKEEKLKEAAGTLTKAQINAALKKAPLAACSVIGSGKVQLVITIDSSGAVQSASGTETLGVCAAKRVQGMSFPPITAPSQTFTATVVVP